ncbi:molybdopterin dinucleotide binding domain-containing protein, partial [Escherichia coli]|uniref:molybdopterin dinucleotide binding domain-containing protein n=1 Tax=Escherichia coli TaxID=562 RepID=UPI002A3617C5
LVTLDFRMSSTCLFSDIVLPTATWYEKDDMNTSDMHPFIHPLSAAVDPAWESRSDWEIYKGIAKAFSQVCVGHLGKETDVVLQPLLHDSPAELSQPCEVLDWRKGECDLIPGKTAPNIVAVERDYPATYERFTSLGPLMDKLGNGGKGISWNTQDEIDFLGKLNYTKRDGPAQGRPLIDTAIDASEVILALAPETNGHVAVKAWQALGEITGREHTHLALHKEDEKIRFRDIQAQPRKIISSPTWSGLESDHVSYNAGYTNVHELIPWRTLSGRQQLYQDHPWMRAFGESLVAYRPPIDTRSVSEMRQIPPNGFPEKALNFLTPHQKWGIHSTYSENLLMLTLSRGGPIVWISETDARELTIVDNDWVEVFNANGALTARAVVSQRVPPGMTMMYHAQERIMNIPGSEVTGMRGGIHNSVTRVCPKPTHMIGGYAQLAWGFNYYGTVGSNRDLNFLTPHQKWGIHSTYSENLLMLTLSRGGPIVWISETDARELTIVDNDWVEVFNANGALTARAVVSQRVPPGMTMMYHAQERIMNIPGSEVTGMRGGIHNSVTRVCPKPTHMIGGYAQLAWGFNYYGTVGSNRDEFIMIRKMKNVNWLDDEGRDQVQEAKK